ncbi:hydroxysteroid dehydrogenase-like protein 2 [Argonauta hians]
MAANTGKLAGKTLFITGASRGIGKYIALKAARDGANIAIAAKTADPHPSLPGTIYTTAKEVEQAGGKSLPCVVDIRYEDQVQKAINETVSKFGGIDILVNNASAISLTGTLQTPMKRYDLMMGINARGTYLCSQACIPHLMKSDNPHILNLSPPLNMNPKWFTNHVAYTMAKYGMSMCVLGMSGELEPHGIAVNALWPRTAIYTAAMKMLGGGDEVEKSCRKPEIMADAAYVILSKDSRTFTGNFCIDDTVLNEVGVTDLEPYSCVPGSTFIPDFFLDVDPATVEESAGSEPSKPSVAAEGQIGKVFHNIDSLLNEDIVKSVNGVYAFHLTGEEAGEWYLDMASGSGAVGKGSPPSGKADVTLTLSDGDFVKIFTGKLKPTMALMSGKLRIKGDMPLALKLEKLMGKVAQKAKL